jgi:hypothetical protein
MRHFSYNEYNENGVDGGCIYTLSEEDIRKQYWPYWYEKMCKKYEQSYVDENYCFEDCLCDWVAVHWAWMVGESQ